MPGGEAVVRGADWRQCDAVDRPADVRGRRGLALHAGIVGVGVRRVNDRCNRIAQHALHVGRVVGLELQQRRRVSGLVVLDQPVDAARNDERVRR